MHSPQLVKRLHQGPRLVLKVLLIPRPQLMRSPLLIRRLHLDLRLARRALLIPRKRLLEAKNSLVGKTDRVRAFEL